MNWKTTLLVVLSATPVLAVVRPCAADPAAQTDARRSAAHRPRRILLNNDGDDVRWPEAATPEGFLSRRTTPFIGTQLDAIFYCTHYSFNECTHNTAVGEIAEAKPPRVPVLHARTLIKQGRDNLQIISDFCHANRMEAWWSMRMNDVHDGKIPEFRSQFKKDHPDWLLGTDGDFTADMIGEARWWSGADYARADVRERAFELIAEVCRNYDLDGVELDFFRHPIFFKPNRLGLPAEPQHVEMMTDFLRRVHAMTVEVNQRRKQPVLIAVRVPETISICNHMGFDIETWVKEKLVDVIVAGGYFHLMPWKEMIELGHAQDIPVYPCVSASRLRERVARQLDRELLLWRGEALNIWEAGADGVYTFNFFDQGPAAYHELGDPDKLRQLPRVYAPSSGTIDKFLGAKVRLQYGHLPLKVTPGQPRTAGLQVNETLPDTSEVRLTLRLRLSEFEQPDRIEVAVNGVPMHGLAVSPLSGRALSAADNFEVPGTWIECSAEPATFRPGRNEVTVSCVQRENDDSLVFQSVQLEVSPR